MDNETNTDYEIIGKYIPQTDEVIKKAYFRQGMIHKKPCGVGREE